MSTHQHEHEFEAALGLPEPLPNGEHILWQGSPDWKALAIQVLHVRPISLYFLAMLAWRFGATLVEGAGVPAALLSIALPLPLALLAIGILLLLAWLVSRTTVYTVTDQRVVMRIGIVLCITFNLPYRTIEAADMRLNPDGTGDISLALLTGSQIAYANLWPHARPWQIKRTQPTLRCIPNVRNVGQILATAISSVSAPGHSKSLGRADEAVAAAPSPTTAAVPNAAEPAPSFTGWRLPQRGGGWFHA
jgi:Bacterial PH domain